MPIISTVLDLDSIKKVTGHKSIHHFESVNSTNSWLLEHGFCGDICISDQQSAGRGRRGNIWVSPKSGNVYFSQCWCFDTKIKHWSLLGLVVGLAIAEALKDIGLSEHGIKWPNDIFHQDKKLGGILLETIDQSGKVVIGIGLNVELPKASTNIIEQPVTNINKVLVGKTVSREELLIKLIERLRNRLRKFEMLDFESFKESWNHWDILQNKQVRFKHQEQTIEGQVMEIDQYGRLGVLKNSGELSFYSSADIKIAKNEDNE